ncbi:MAG: STAS-like domain-containing protein [Alphaproteobacteria bacterium]|nr:STAS-like domain-containing protein [Alphaproteobacteria bacterium]
MKILSIANDFSRFPAGRYKDDGPYSGEKFREEFLVPALRANEVVFVDLSGTKGFGSSFLEEAFGGLLRIGFTKEEVVKKLRLISDKETRLKEVESYLGVRLKEGGDR